MHFSGVKPFNCYLWSFVWIQRLVEHNMDISDVPIIVGEFTDNFGVMNDGCKKDNSLEMVERRVFATCWTNPFPSPPFFHPKRFSNLNFFLSPPFPVPSHFLFSPLFKIGKSFGTENSWGRT